MRSSPLSTASSLQLSSSVAQFLAGLVEEGARPTIEGLPLWGGVDIVEGCVSPGVEDEVGVRREVASSEVELAALDVLLRQLSGPHHLRQGRQLGGKL